jgi:hypothetical protein
LTSPTTAATSTTVASTSVKYSSGGTIPDLWVVINKTLMGSGEPNVNSNHLRVFPGMWLNTYLVFGSGWPPPNQSKKWAAIVASI